jgi:ACS family tartrate transporter-like MFS transporter
MHEVVWRLLSFLGLGYPINAPDRFNVSMAARSMNQNLRVPATT